MNRLCVFEDAHYKSLLPLVYNRPAYDLRCGMFSLLERIINYYPQTGIELFCREYLSDAVREKDGKEVNSLNLEEDGYLFMNGRLLMQSPIPLDGKEEIGLNGGTVVYARLKKESCKKITCLSFLEDDIRETFRDKIRFVETDAVLVNYFWDIINHNNVLIEKDFREYVKKGRIEGKLYDGVYLVNPDNILVGRGSKIKPCCVLDAEDGPIYIGKNVSISSNCSLEGPLYIGDESKINAQTRIRSGSNIGRLCKIGGEIEHSIIHDFSNKQHDGFLGHSYIGSWVNLGADTVCSNLKNNYENINIKLYDNVINTGQMFLGMAVGDHSKSAINTTFMTGTIVGFASNIVTSRFPPKFVPSFSWCLDKGIMPQDFGSVINTAEKAMARRKIALSEIEKDLYKTIYNLTTAERIK